MSESHAEQNAQPASPGRFVRGDIVFLLLAAVLIALGVRLATFIRHHTVPVDEQQQMVAQRLENARAGQKIVMPLPARPGNLYGRSRRSPVLVAGSRQVPSCFIDPQLLDDRKLSETCAQLAELFDLNLAELYASVVQRRDRRFAWVAREITREQAEAVRDMDIRAVGIQYEWKRRYPNGSLGGTVVGFCQKDGQPGGGVELRTGPFMTGRDGRRVLRGDAYRRAFSVESACSQRPIDGGNVFLSLDLVIQEYLQEAVGEAVEKFGAKWGTGVVIDPWTGDILAMCSAPEFDPNRYNTTPAEDMLNRAICCPYEPGSVFKPLMASAAVEAGAVRYDSKIDCEAGVYYAHRGGRIRDTHANHTLSVRDVVIRSSNIGMAKIGEKLGNAAQWDIVHRWGFGRPTGVELPAETAGIVRPLESWDGYSLRRVPFGQEISVSSLQLAMAFSAVANGGLLMKPRLVQRVTNARGEEVYSSEPLVVRRVLSASVAAETLSALQGVVDDPRGTGKNCRMEKWTSWGKTGTAQIPGPQGYIPDAYTGSFVGGAPAGKPAVVCLISIYWPDRSKGYYGGTVAAPYVRDVLEQTLEYLDIPSDRLDPPTVASGP